MPIMPTVPDIPNIPLAELLALRRRRQLRCVAQVLGLEGGKVTAVNAQRSPRAGIEGNRLQAAHLDLASHPAVREAQQVGNFRCRVPILAEHGNSNGGSQAASTLRGAGDRTITRVRGCDELGGRLDA